MPYEEELQAFLYYKALVPIIPDPNERMKYVTNDAMKIWIPAFVHESANPNGNENYERLETYGDSVLKHEFTGYLLQKIPDVTSQGITAYHDNYMSTEPQRDFTIQMGLYKYLIYDDEIDITRSSLEDLFESFVGALSKVSDDIQFGGADRNVFNLIIYLFQNIELNPHLIHGRPRSQIKEIFEMMKWIKVNAKVTGPEGYQQEANIAGQSQINVVLTPKAVEYFKSIGDDLKWTLDGNIIIGSAIARTKEEAKVRAYTEAATRLASIGITRESVGQWKEELQFRSPLVEPFLEKAVDKYKRQGFYRLIFKTPKASVSKSGGLVQLLGEYGDGRRVILVHTFTNDKDDTAIKARLLEAYINIPINQMETVKITYKRV